jgi:LmbE family N-acetylglucosaminyl deacetylase
MGMLWYGERGTADPDTWPPARLAGVRRWEAAAAMAVLGLTEHRNLGLPDGALTYHAQQGRPMLGQLLDEIQPDTILTFKCEKARAPAAVLHLGSLSRHVVGRGVREIAWHLPADRRGRRRAASRSPASSHAAPPPTADPTR